MSDCVLSDLGIVCALGDGPAEVLATLLGDRRPFRAPGAEGAADGSPFSVPDPPPLRRAEPRLRSRNNRLLQRALDQIRGPVDAALARWGSDRVAVVLGTSTSGIAEAERAFERRAPDGSLPPEFHLGQMEIGSPSEFLGLELGLTGPAYTISTACSSGAKALLSAKRLLDMGAADAVLAGGVDSLCRSTLAGFAALEAVSPERSNPLSRNRKGLNIGEGAALFLASREGRGPRLLGGGESSDAHHVSAPDPSGAGAAAAMREALARSGLAAREIEYLNLHGTATRLNDSMEAAAVAAVLGGEAPCSSTKPLSGHALGAAGALEAGFCWLLLGPDNPEGRLPAHEWDGQCDPALPRLAVVAGGARLGRPLRIAMSNSFGFGGSNACLVLARGRRPGREP